jgi:hypothetical protein
MLFKKAKNIQNEVVEGSAWQPVLPPPLLMIEAAGASRKTIALP